LIGFGLYNILSQTINPKKKNMPVAIPPKTYEISLLGAIDDDNFIKSYKLLQVIILY
jgi:hypothetical protein